MNSLNHKFALAFVAAWSFVSINAFSKEQNSNKHQIPPEPEGWTFASSNQLISIRTRAFAQGRLTWVEQESGAAKADALFFSLSRARTQLDGFLLNSSLTYFVQLELMTPSFLDVSFNYAFKPQAQFQFGLFRVPFIRLFLTPEYDFAFADFSNNMSYWNLGRDVGFNIHGVVADKVGYNLFAVNGNNANTKTRVEPTLGFKVDGYLMGKDPGYREINWIDFTGPRLTAGLGLALDFGSSTAAVLNDTLLRMTADAIFQIRGLTAVAAFYYGMNYTSTDNNPGTDQNIGWDFVASHWVVPKVLVALKGGATWRQGAGFLGEGNTDEYETGFAVSYFAFKRNVKLTADYTAELNNTAANNADHRIRGQVQLQL